jgi:hypothetical protein
MPDDFAPTTMLSESFWATEPARWAQRLAQAPYKNFVRELAGLSDEELSALAEQTRKHPHLRMPGAWRYAVGATIVGVVAGAGMLVGGFEARRETFVATAEVIETLLLGGAGLLMAALVGASVCWLMYHRRAPAMRTYSDLVQHVTVLDERHPWLYETCELARHADADAYRRKTLDIRGELRGVDLPMMRLVIAAQAEVLRCKTAFEIRQALQSDRTRALSSSALPAPATVTTAEQVHVAGEDVLPTAAESATLLRFPQSESSGGAAANAAASTS